MAVKDYRCLFLRDELMPAGMRNSQMNLKIRHEPFSVLIDYVMPDRGMRAYYHASEGKLHTTAFPFPLDPNGALAKSRSKNSVAEAGLLNAIQRFCQRWETEKKLGLTRVTIQDDLSLKLKVEGEKKERELSCVLITTIHDPKDRAKFQEINVAFYVTKVYFDKKTGLPFKMEGYDWPTKEKPEGELLEGYTYLDLETNVGLADKDFTLRK
jgi:hypothetical protein